VAYQNEILPKKEGSMKRTMILAVAILVLVMAYQPLVLAQTIITEGFIEGDRRINTGVNFSAFVPGTSTFKTGYYVGGQVSYDMMRWFALGVEAGYLQTELQSSGENIGTLRGCPLLADLILKVPMDMDSFVFTPYGVAGFGCLLMDITSGDAITDNGRIDVNTPFLMKFGGGFDATFLIVLVIFFEASYIYTKIEFNEKLTNQTFGLGKENLNAGFVGGGIKYRF